MLYNFEGLLFLFAVLIFFLFIVFFFGRKIRDRKLIKSVTSLNRGTKSERKLVLKLLKLGFPSSNIYHDLYVKKGDGWYSQSDVVLITKSAVIVFEVKDYSGWLFGKGYQTHWTQVLNYGKEKHRFYNPVRQNKAHIEAIKNRIPQLINTPIYSVIVFYGNCELKDISQIPADTFLLYPQEIPHFLQSVSERKEIDHTALSSIKTALKESVENGDNPEIRAVHVKNIKDKFFD